jgi:cellulose binding protein with CBM2 domain
LTTAAPSFRRSTRNAALVAVALAAISVAVTALLVSTGGAESAASVNGNATHFAGFGTSYSGCGVPQQELDSADFVSLNVFNTPGDYSPYPRPVPPLDSQRIGRWENGRNCGRFIQVTIGNYCTGVNDGAPGKAFCREGSWITDDFNGATLTMVVADGCAEATAWCRDDPDHLGLATTSLTRFTKNGLPVGHIDPGHWNNRHVSWSYVPTPHYSGDLRLGFLRDAQPSRPVLAFSNLPNGIHGVEYQGPDGSWQQAPGNGDMGQSFIPGPTTSGGTDYRIRVRDASDALVNKGRIYRYSLPSTCFSRCADAYTKIDYTTEEAPAGSSEAWTTAQSPPPTTTSTDTGTGTGTAKPDTDTAIKATTGAAAPATTTTTQQQAPPPPAPPKTTTTRPPPPQPGCTATYKVIESWPGGYKIDVTVRNSGPTPITGWSTSFSVAGSQRVNNPWNAVVNQYGRQVTAVNQSYNGSLAPGATTGWGAIVSGLDQPVSGLGCAPR